MRQHAHFMAWKPIVAASDLLIVNAAYLVAYVLHSGGITAAHEQMVGYARLSPVVSLLALMSFHLSDLYRNWLRKTFTHVLYSTVIGNVTALIATATWSFWSGHLLPRSVLVIAACIQVILIALYREIARRVYRRWYGCQHTIVIAESNEQAWDIAEKFVEHWAGWYEVDQCLARRGLKAPYTELMSADAIVISADLKDKEEVIYHCFREGKEVLVVPNLFELTFCGAEPWEIDDLLVFKVHPHRLNPAQELLKRSIDILGSILLLAVASPLLLFAFVAIPLTSKGSAIFRQVRVGKDGRRFRIFKFRTMVSNAETKTGPVLAIENDPRITRLGRFMRSTRIDEIPQLFNVLLDDMSLIGPRPERPIFVEQFDRQLPAYTLRHLVKPGITGLAQVLGRYSTTAERKLRFDLFYIYNYSLLLDIKIFLQTIRVVLLRERASGLKTSDLAGRRRSLESIAAGQRNRRESWDQPMPVSRSAEPETKARVGAD